MYRKNKKRKIIIFSLLGVLLLMSIGYASFSSSLKIKGTSKVTSDWNVQITNITKSTFSGSAEESTVDGVKVDPTCSDSGTPKLCEGLSASINVDLYEIGDSAEYDITISNKGNIDAKLDDIIVDNTNSNNAVLITYSGYSKGERLFKSGSSGSSKTIHVKVAYNPEYTGEPTSSEINLTFNYVQAEAGTIPDTNTYVLTYDYQTNGGTKSNETANYDEGVNVDLTKTDSKPGYSFVGWNTDSSATTGLSTYTMPSNNTTLYAIYELSVKPPVIDSFGTTHTINSITAYATAHDDETSITKYEFSSDNGSTWVDNGTSGTYTFTGLTTGQTYNVKVRVTNEDGFDTVSDAISVTPNLPVATFIEYISSSSTTVEITYPEECSNGTYTCTYQKNSETSLPADNTTLTDNKINIEFTESGTVTATVSDGTNTVSSTYTVNYIAGDKATGIETFDTVGMQEWTVPATGDYFLQVWGAQGGTYSSKTGGLGGYSYGTVTLNKGDKLYIYTGGQGSEGTSGGGFNGGGNAQTNSAGGGGASDIRINSDSLYARVIVAGGGGGPGRDSCATATTGYGGGETGGGLASQSSCGTQAGGGTQTAGGVGGLYSGTSGSAGTFGQGGSSSSGSWVGGGGGGGWYGGGSGTTSGYSNGGGGGSGYVYKNSTASNYPSGCLLTSDYYLIDAETIAGDTEFDSPSGGKETGHSGNGYVKITYEIDTTVNDKMTLSVDNVTTNSISVTATSKSGLTVTKYEFSKDNGSTWTSNGTNGTYTFTGLTHDTDYNIKARLTTSEGKVVSDISVKTDKIITPTFNDTNSAGSVNTTITYMSGCGSTYTCTYTKNEEEPVTVSSTTETVNFTSAGKITATISDGTNTVTETHEVKENVTLSFSTSKTTNSITVTDSVTAPTGVSKYEFQVDGGDWVEGTSNVYVFDKLTSGTHSVNSRVTTNFGTVKTGTSTNVTLNTITAPTYKVEYTATDNGDVTITYPSGCGSTFTCTYTKNEEEPVTVTSTTATVNFSADGEVGASITDGTNTVSNSYTVTMPLDVIDDYGPNMLVVGAGDGLYSENDGDDTAYFYRGANPNNYITLGGDTYRIMSIDTSGNLKVIRDTAFNLVWDPGYSTSISGITSSYSTAGTRYSSTSTDYCYTSSASSYYGCKSWGSSTSTFASNGTTIVTQMPWEAGSTTLKNLPTYDSYINVYLNGGTYPTESGTTTLTSWYSSNVDSTVQSKMVEHLWNVGPLKYNNSDLATDISQEAAYKWKGKVGLMTATDYVRASTNSGCTNVYSYNSNASCYNNSSTHNWLYKNAYQWTMAPYSTSHADYVWNVYDSSRLVGYSAFATYGVRPVLYLSSSIRLKGKGTADSPYYIPVEPTASAKATLTKLGQSAKEYNTNTGNGIYEDNEGGYYYRGANPANYIKLGSDLYRIMSIDTSGNLKVIRDTATSIVWDPGYSTSITNITNSSSTAGTRYSSTSTDYCYNSSASSYGGCKSWGSKTSTLASNGTTNVTQMPWLAGSTTLKNLPTYDSYLNVYLNGGTYPTESGTTTLTSWYSSNVDSSVQSKMVEHLWNVGPVASDNSLTLAQNISQEAAYKWKGKVGLMTATDYVRASTNSACTNVYSYNSNSSCYNNSSTHNWLYKDVYQWTMVPYPGSNVLSVWNVRAVGNLSSSSAYSSSGVRPVLYLSSNIQLSGTGTDSDNAFTIVG